MRAIISTSYSRARCTSQRKTLAMFMGSNIGNYEPERSAAKLLALLAGALRPGDGLLLGADLKKDRGDARTAPTTIPPA